MTGRRKYDEGCAIAYALDLVGERWALLVVRELILGPKRFTDLQAGLPGVSTDVLTQRLRDLEGEGVLRRGRLARPAASWIYELTEWGAELEPVLIQLARWSSRSPGLPMNAPISIDSLILSLKALFDSRAAAGLTATVAIHVGEDRFWIDIADGRIEVGRGEADHPDLTVNTDLPGLRRLFQTRQPVVKSLDSATSQLDGDVALLDTWRRLFVRPEPVQIDTG